MKRLTRDQAAVIGAFTGILAGPFSDMHRYIEKVLGHFTRVVEHLLLKALPMRRGIHIEQNRFDVNLFPPALAENSIQFCRNLRETVLAVGGDDPFRGFLRPYLDLGDLPFRP